MGQYLSQPNTDQESVAGTHERLGTYGVVSMQGWRKSQASCGEGTDLWGQPARPTGLTALASAPGAAQIAAGTAGWPAGPSPERSWPRPVPAGGRTHSGAHQR